MITLVGCGKTIERVTPEKIVEDASVVLKAGEGGLFADTTGWTVTPNTIFHTHTDEKITGEDIKSGDLISYKHEVPVLESYPSQGTLKEVFLFDDEYSLKVSTAIASFLENQPEGNLVSLDLVSIEDTKLTAEMKKWDLENDENFIVEIDLETNAFEISEGRDSEK